MSLEAIEHISNKRILFSPLNWGFGHVSRSIPILDQLRKNGNELFVACDENQCKVYKEYFSDLHFERWKGYPFQFLGNGNFAMDIVRSLPKIRIFSKNELEFVEEFCRRKKIDVVLSDHRYFFRNKNTKSIFITHQITLPLPWYLKLVQIIHANWLNKFDEIWVLDTKKHEFAGELSKGETKPIQRFLGPVSRFSKNEGTEKSGTLILVSGPEPYANQFYLAQKLRLEPGWKLVYQGKIETNTEVHEISWKRLDEELVKTQKLISRSGYSTIMDIQYLGCSAELHATKGQLEQEYLSAYVNRTLN